MDGERSHLPSSLPSPLPPLYLQQVVLVAVCREVDLAQHDVKDVGSLVEDAAGDARRRVHLRWGMGVWERVWGRALGTSHAVLHRL